MRFQEPRSSPPRRLKPCSRSWRPGWQKHVTLTSPSRPTSRLSVTPSRSLAFSRRCAQNAAISILPLSGGAGRCRCFTRQPGSYGAARRRWRSWPRCQCRAGCRHCVCCRERLRLSRHSSLFEQESYPVRAFSFVSCRRLWRHRRRRKGAHRQI